MVGRLLEPETFGILLCSREIFVRRHQYLSSEHTVVVEFWKLDAIHDRSFRNQDLRAEDERNRAELKKRLVAAGGACPFGGDSPSAFSSFPPSWYGGTEDTTGPGGTAPLSAGGGGEVAKGEEEGGGKKCQRHLMSEEANAAARCPRSQVREGGRPPGTTSLVSASQGYKNKPSFLAPLTSSFSCRSIANVGVLP